MPTPCDCLDVPSGQWAIGVSGGADSVALLLLLHRRPDLSLHVVHLNHQTRGQASDGDAAFVANLAAELKLSCTIALREELERSVLGLPSNRSARFRALRLALFKQCVRERNLQGALLAHHADDQAETVLLRLLRGAGPPGLMGMATKSRMDDLSIVRPLLHVRRAALQDLLLQRHQSWREDASNQSPLYARNRVRRWLSEHPQLVMPLTALAQQCRRYTTWLRRSAPALTAQFPASVLADLPGPLGRQSARRWLIEQECPGEELSPAVLDRLRLMAADAATPRCRHFPGGVSVRRRRGVISASSAASPTS